MRTQTYSNCLMLACDGTPMCRCGLKRARWYLSKNLAVIVEEEPFVIRLLFEAKGLGKHNKPYYLQVMQNRCVVCGKMENLSLHHCIPRCFRKYFPSEYKEHSSHDVLLLCLECHSRYEKYALEKKKAILREYNRKYQDTTEKKQIEKAVNIANTLLKYEQSIPEKRKEELFARISKIFGYNIAYNDLEKVVKEYSREDSEWKRVTESIDNIFAFMISWRRHFVGHMQPKYLPHLWDIRHSEILN